MKPASSAPVSHRPWFRRFLLALLLGGAAWWLVDYCLRPKPRWRRNFPDSSVALAIFGEDEAGKRLVACELNTSEERPQVHFLAILDAANGQMTHRLAPFDLALEGTTDWGQFGITLPSLRENFVWRLLGQQNGEERTVELRVWRFQNEAQEQVVKTWRYPADRPFRFIRSSQTGGLLLVQSLLPWECSLLPQLPGGWPAVTATMTYGILESAERELSDFTLLTRHSNPVLCEVGSLDPEGKHWQTRSQWCLSAFRAKAAPAFSPDGQLIAFPDSYLPSLVLLHAQWGNAVPKAIEPFTMQNWTKHPGTSLPRGIQLYETLTGKLRTVLPTGELAVPNVLWIGPYLLYSKMQRLFLKAPSNPGDPPGAYQVSSIDDFKGANLVDTRALKTLEFPQHVLFGIPLSLTAWNIEKERFGQLVQNGQPARFEEYALEDGHLHISRQVPLFDASVRQFGYMGLKFVGDQLVIGYQCDSLPPFLRKPLEGNPTLVKWARMIWPEHQTRTTLLDLQTQKELWTWKDTMAMVMPNWEIRPLILMGFKESADQKRLQLPFLEYWDLPIVLYSRWWAIASGIVVMFLAFLLLLRRRHSADAPPGSTRPA